MAVASPALLRIGHTAIIRGPCTSQDASSSGRTCRLSFFPHDVESLRQTRISCQQSHSRALSHVDNWQHIIVSWSSSSSILGHGRSELHNGTGKRVESTFRGTHAVPSMSVSSDHFDSLRERLSKRPTKAYSVKHRTLEQEFSEVHARRTHVGSGVPEEPIEDDIKLAWDPLEDTAISFCVLLKHYTAIRQDVQTWSDFFFQQHSRRPKLVDVDCTRIQWLQEKFREYLILRARLEELSKDDPEKEEQFIETRREFFYWSTAPCYQLGVSSRSPSSSKNVPSDWIAERNPDQLADMFFEAVSLMEPELEEAELHTNSSNQKRRVSSFFRGGSKVAVADFERKEEVAADEAGELKRGKSNRRSYSQSKGTKEVPGAADRLILGSRRQREPKVQGVKKRHPRQLQRELEPLIKKELVYPWQETPGWHGRHYIT